MAGSRIPEALASLFAVLDEMEIRYFAGGSVASSIHGIARYTQDVDIVADLAPEHMERLAARLSSHYYADAGQMRDSIRYGRAFNIIHFASGFKIDVFPFQRDPFHEGELARSERKVWNIDQNSSLELQVASAEDTILEKLVWYKRGGQTSERQWSDVLGIVMSRSLDWDYLRSWAANLGVTDLLEKLFGEARQL
jgi:hypothetical protein